LKPSNAKTLLFDLDGTLVDNFQALYRAYLHTAEQLGLKETVDFPTMRKLIGGSLSVTVPKLLGGDERVEEALKIFVDYFQTIMFEDLFLLPGAQWILESLKNKDYKLAVFTNKIAQNARSVCEHLQIAPYLDDIIGVGETPHRKPQPEFTRYALEHLKAEPETSLLIGDSPYDAEAAYSVNMPYGLVTTGTHTHDELVGLTPEPLGVFENLYTAGETLFNLDKPAPAHATLS
tara:strand:+ start:27029 stop:27727 length:699 start_codon:yes stop_codon:yes gene_type:complete